MKKKKVANQAPTSSSIPEGTVPMQVVDEFPINVDDLKPVDHDPVYQQLQDTYKWFHALKVKRDKSQIDISLILMVEENYKKSILEAYQTFLLMQPSTL